MSTVPNNLQIMFPQHRTECPAFQDRAECLPVVDLVQSPPTAPPPLFNQLKFSGSSFGAGTIEDAAQQFAFLRTQVFADHKFANDALRKVDACFLAKFGVQGPMTSGRGVMTRCRASGPSSELDCVTMRSIWRSWKLRHSI